MKGRPTRAEIDLDSLAHNFRVVRRRVADRVEVMPVVKANAYGHGAVRCAVRLRREGARWFCVALAEEAAELRDAGLHEPVLCLGGVWGEQAAWCVAHNVIPVIYRFDMAEAVARAAQSRGVTADVHLKIDTGTGRLGVRYDHAAEFARRLSGLQGVRVDGVMTHFAAADEPSLDDFTRTQIERFRIALDAARAAGHRPTYHDLANSAGIFAHPRAHGNMVRPGGVLYGLRDDVLAPSSEPPALRVVMSLRSAITLLKEVPAGETLGYGRSFDTKRPTLVATLPIGYNDGVPRALSNRGRVILHGRFAPIVGRVSMDLTMVDVTDVAAETEVREGDQVTLIGAEGATRITAEEVAARAGTISYEVTCGIGSRVPRSYAEKQKSGDRSQKTE
jgi:alanine racemase